MSYKRSIEVCHAKRANRHKVFEVLEQFGQIGHSRRRSIFNFMVNVVAGLIAYSYREKKPSLNLHPCGLTQLPAAVF